MKKNFVLASVVSLTLMGVAPTVFAADRNDTRAQIRDENRVDYSQVPGDVKRAIEPEHTGAQERELRPQRCAQRRNRLGELLALIVDLPAKLLLSACHSSAPPPLASLRRSPVRALAASPS